MLWNIPLESIEERYSAQWNQWIPREFWARNIKFQTIEGDTLTDKIESGSFLDVCSTNFFKAEQIKKLCKLAFEGKIRDGDILFFHDLWFPGLEALAYIRDGLKIDFKITGIFHAGTYTPHDPITRWGMGRWGEALENSWFELIEKIFVATNYHKELILKNRKCDEDKIVVTGLPIYAKDYPKFFAKKENLIIFPHRLEPERQPEVFDKFFNDRGWMLPLGWDFLKTKEICKTKQDYLKILSIAKIVFSCSNQETWGIAIQEAVFYDCLPVVPNSFSYKELYLPEFRYPSGNWDILSTLIKNMISNPEKFEVLGKRNKGFLVRRGETAIDNILVELLKIGDII